MNRWNKIIILVFLFAGVVSCKKDNSINIEDGKPIQFAVPKMDVEARSITKDAFSPGDEFGVIGYCVPYTVGTSNFNYNAGNNPWLLKKGNCSPDVFFKQKVVVGENGCTYDYSNTGGNNPKYWYRNGYDTKNSPNASITDVTDYKYSFFAYYPYDGSFDIEAPTSETTKGAPIITFTMPQNGTDLSTLLDYKNTPDAMMAVLYDQLQSQGLTFNFSHVLTGLGFEVNNFSDYKLIVHSVTLSGSFYKKVKIDFTNDYMQYSFPEDRYTGTYTIFDGSNMPEGGLVLEAPTDGQTVTSSPSPIGPITDGSQRNEFLLLISGNQTSFGENITVNIDYTFGDSPRKTVSKSRPGTFTPQPGVKYTAQLNFVGDAFILQFVENNSGDWEDGVGADGDINNDDIIFE